MSIYSWWTQAETFSRHEWSGIDDDKNQKFRWKNDDCLIKSQVFRVKDTRAAFLRIFYTELKILNDCVVFYEQRTKYDELSLQLNGNHLKKLFHFSSHSRIEFLITVRWSATLAFLLTIYFNSIFCHSDVLKRDDKKATTKCKTNDQKRQTS